MPARLRTGARLFLLSATALVVVGAIGQGVGWVLLTTTLGPTAYILLAHPHTEAAQVRSSVLGHTCAAACGLLCLAVFGLWPYPSTAGQRTDTWHQIGAEALAVGLTLFLLVLLDAHHPPAAATALLITSGIARPGPPLYGMLTGLALLIAAAAALSPLRSPARRASGIGRRARRGGRERKPGGRKQG
ncbi:HPP family protein [Streptomyces lushanensis]|uniref:HPP family protein n=1 Tax=Streptomyces lushanensis TaxID=1434255 RepID=UPI00082B3603|nr:HPP family protein [Streptomyces lushanensis]